MYESLTGIQLSARTVSILLFVLLASAFLLRVTGIGYGLPLFVVADEPPSISGALKMMELRTLIPAFHEEAFKTTLYFPPFMSYLYLIPFATVMLLSFLFFDGSFAAFREFTIYDPSLLFITARVITALFGTATIYLLYKTAERLFASRSVALLPAAFLAFSLLHVNFSHWARHWIPVTFLFVLVLYILSRDDMRVSKRYTMALLVAGAGFGVNYQMVLALPLIVLWFIFYDRIPIQKAIHETWVYLASALYLLLAAAAIVLYPAPLFIHGGTALTVSHSLGGLLSGYRMYAEALLRNEPFLLISTLIGAVALFYAKRRLAIIIVSFSLFYIAFFYFFFLLEERYIVLLYPLFALISGFGWAELWRRFSSFRIAVATVCIAGLAFMAGTALRFDQLLLRNDTRIQAIEEAEKELPRGVKVIVLARLMRISAVPEAIAEQESIDPASLRKVDQAERSLEDRFLTRPRYHALNLYAVKSEEFLRELAVYAGVHEYEYVLYSPEFAEQRDITGLESLGTEKQRFAGYEDEQNDITNGFGKGVIDLFRMQSNGPTMVLRRLE